MGEVAGEVAPAPRTTVGVGLMANYLDDDGEWDLNGALALQHIPETCCVPECENEGSEPVWMNGIALWEPNADGNYIDGDEPTLYGVCPYHVAVIGLAVADVVDLPHEWHPERFN